MDYQKPTTRISDISGTIPFDIYGMLGGVVVL